MRRTPVLLAALLSAAATAAGGLAAGAQAPARLRLLDTDPLLVRVTGFKSREHARLSILDGSRTLRRTATAGSAGAFTMRLAGVDVNGCLGFSITVVGDRGSRAVYKRPPGECPLP